MSKFFTSLALSIGLLSAVLPSVASAKKPVPPASDVIIICVLNPLYGTGGYQPYILCTITKI